VVPVFDGQSNGHTMSRSAHVRVWSLPVSTVYVGAYLEKFAAVLVNTVNSPEAELQGMGPLLSALRTLNDIVEQ